MKFYYCLVISLLFSFCLTETSEASRFQPGRIITNNGDTIAGLIDPASGSRLDEECRFKEQEHQKEVTFSPAKIKGFILDKNHTEFVSKPRPYLHYKLFFQVLAKGKMNLYYYKKGRFTNFYVEKTGDFTMHALPYKQRQAIINNGYTQYYKTLESTYHIDTLKMVMKDRPDLFPQIEAMSSPERNSLIKLVSDYNSGKVLAAKAAVKDTTGQGGLILLRKGKKMNLYLDDNDVDDHFYIQKGDHSPKIELPFKRAPNTRIDGMVIRSYTKLSTNHIDTLKKYMADAKPLYPTINDIKVPTERNLGKLVDEYNSYTDEATYIKEHSPKRLPVNLDVVPGFDFMLTNYQDPVVRFGIYVNIGFVNSNQHLFLKTGFFVFDGVTPYVDQIMLDHPGVIYDPHVIGIKVPAQLEWRFLSKGFQPSLALGYNYYHYSKFKPYIDTYKLYSTALFPVISPGAYIKISKRFSLHFNLEFEFKNDNLISYTPKELNRVSLFSGLQIRL